MNEIENINDKKIFEPAIISDTFSRHKISVMISWKTMLKNHNQKLNL